jgi:hypothetical protein
MIASDSPWRSPQPKSEPFAGDRKQPEMLAGHAAPLHLLAGLLLASLFLWPWNASAKTKTHPASPPPPSAHTEETLIPVATATGIVRMTQQDYDIYVKPMVYLPHMPKAYVFGHTIPQPKTDKHGYIHLSPLPPAVPETQHK